MRKLTIILAFALVAFVAGQVQAQEKYVAGGFEAAGHVFTGFGYQHQTTNAHPNTANVTNAEATSNYGVLGNYLAATPVTSSENFQFFVDTVELDLMKSFGENVRLRADVDFGSTASGPRGGLNLEQAYATANIPVGNGIEFLVGKFNVPVGFEAVDRVDNDLISNTLLYRADLRPTLATGGKLYYPFTDMFDLHFYVVNSIQGDVVKNDPDFPSGGLRFGVNWGDEGAESTVGLSGFGGHESGVVGGSKKISFGGDLDFNWWVTEAFAVGGEGLFRIDPSTGAGATKVTTFGGLLNLHYDFSDVWDGTLRYSYVKQNNATNTPAALSPLALGAAGAGILTGFRGQSHEISLGGGYMVADGASIRVEGRFDWVQNDAAASRKSYDYGGAVAFAYDF